MNTKQIKKSTSQCTSQLWITKTARGVTTWPEFKTV